MRARLVCLFVFALPALAFAQAPGPDLAPLLSGFERCKANAAFDALQQSLVARFSNDFDAKVARNDQAVSVVVPTALRGAMGAPTTMLKPDHTLVSVPLGGQFMGFAVQKIEFAFGNENGISVRSLVLAGPVAPVKAAFAKGLASAQKKANSSEGAEVSFKVLDTMPATLMCDFSN